MKTRKMLWSQQTSFGKQTNSLIKDDKRDECVLGICYGDCISTNNTNTFYPQGYYHYIV